MTLLVAIIPQLLQRLPLLLSAQPSTGHILALSLLDGLLLVFILEQILEMSKICAAARVEMLLRFVGSEVGGFVEFGAGTRFEMGFRVMD